MKTYTPDSLIIASRQDLINIINEQYSYIDKLTKENISQIDKLTNEITELKMQLDWFKRQIFGTRSERFIPDDEY